MVVGKVDRIPDHTGPTVFAIAVTMIMTAEANPARAMSTVFLLAAVRVGRAIVAAVFLPRSRAKSGMKMSMTVTRIQLFSGRK